MDMTRRNELIRRINNDPGKIRIVKEKKKADNPSGLTVPGRK